MSLRKPGCKRMGRGALGVLAVAAVMGAAAPGRCAQVTYYIGSADTVSALGRGTPATSIPDALARGTEWTTITAEQGWVETQDWTAANFTTLELSCYRFVLRGVCFIRDTKVVHITQGEFQGPLVVQNCEQVKIQNAKISGGLFLDRCASALVADCEFLPVPGVGPAAGAVVQGCSPGGSGSTGVHFEACRFRGTGPMPALVIANSAATVNRCQFENLTGRGIQVQQDSNVTINGALVTGAVQQGIVIGDSEAVIENCEIKAIAPLQGISRGIEFQPLPGGGPMAQPRKLSIQKCHVMNADVGVSVFGNYQGTLDSVTVGDWGAPASGGTPTFGIVVANGFDGTIAGCSVVNTTVAAYAISGAARATVNLSQASYLQRCAMVVDATEVVNIEEFRIAEGTQRLPAEGRAPLERGIWIRPMNVATAVDVRHATLIRPDRGGGPGGVAMEVGPGATGKSYISTDRPDGFTTCVLNQSAVVAGCACRRDQCPTGTR